MYFGTQFVIPVIPGAISRSAEHSTDGRPSPPIPIEFCAQPGQSALRRESKKGFAERLWIAAIATGDNQAKFWVNGARFAEDGCHICYCAAILGVRLGLKPATIAHDIRGHLGSEKPRRLDKKTFERLFGCLVPYRGQVWMILIPGLTVATRDFEQFRWRRVGNRGRDDVGADPFTKGTCICAGPSGFGSLVNSDSFRGSEIDKWPFPDEGGIPFDLADVNELPCDWPLLPGDWNA
jgi:hypothetical protein